MIGVKKFIIFLWMNQSDVRDKSDVRDNFYIYKKNLILIYI